MLVIGIQHNGSYKTEDLDIDVDVDSPRRIHDLLSKKASGTTFDHIICVENDTVVAEFENEVDYDLSELSDDDIDLDDNEDDSDDDSLHEDDENIDD